MHQYSYTSIHVNRIYPYLRNRPFAAKPSLYIKLWAIEDEILGQSEV